MRRASIAAVALCAGGCSGTQSVLAASGPQADAIAGLWWLFFVVLSVVYVLVLGATLMALARRRSDVAAPDGATLHGLGLRSDSSERRLALVIAGSVGVTIVVLIVFLFASVGAGRSLAALSGSDEDALEIQVTGRQWWWEIQYKHAQPSRVMTTANELHIPIGQPVKISTTSRDVIHSLWIPNLHGKRDLIPGRYSSVWIQANQPGVYRGQCAEFCGLQHANMALLVVAEPEDEFNAWLDSKRAPAAEPRTEEERRGREIFVTGPCALCHRVGGTPAMSRLGPDLTHVASRRTLAAGTLPNNRGSLGAWLSDPQHVKPGARMPPTGLPPDDLQALLAYLQSLK